MKIGGVLGGNSEFHSDLSRSIRSTIFSIERQLTASWLHVIEPLFTWNLHLKKPKSLNTWLLLPSKFVISRKKGEFSKLFQINLTEANCMNSRNRLSCSTIGEMSCPSMFFLTSAMYCWKLVFLKICLKTNIIFKRILFFVKISIFKKVIYFFEPHFAAKGTRWVGQCARRRCCPPCGWRPESFSIFKDKENEYS